MGAAEAKTASSRQDKTIVRSRPLVATFIIVAGLAAILLGMALSVAAGTANISLETIWHTLSNFEAGNEHHLIIWELRIPRALAGALVGAAFATAGAIMQGMTRNPIADTGLMGINAGAGFVLVLVFAFFPSLPFEGIILFSFVGAGLGAGLVYGIAYMARGGGGLSPLKLVLAGAVVGSLITGISQALSLLFQINYDLVFWSAGGISTANWLQVKVMLPWIAGGLLVALILSRSITVLSLGEEIAAGLGQRTKLVKGIGAVVVMVLAGASVATVGGVAFVGLMIPHVARYLVGVDYRWIIPCSAVLGAVLVLLADIGAKLVSAPYETPLGAIIAVIGVPFFLYLARKERREL